MRKFCFAQYLVGSSLAVLLLNGCGSVAAQQQPKPTISRDVVGSSKLSAPMVMPNVQHHDEQQTTHYDIVTRTCPDGYEGHFVDMQQGFDGGFDPVTEGLWVNGYQGGPEMFTVCFTREFMEKLRKDKDMRARKPVMHAG